MKINEWVQRARQGFQPTFWVANTLELFERLAFTGESSLTVYLPSRWVSASGRRIACRPIFGVIFSLPSSPAPSSIGTGLGKHS